VDRRLGEGGGGGEEMAEYTKRIFVLSMEESGEQCAVVFALTVTETAGSVIINAKKTVHCSRNSSMVVSHRQAKGGLAFVAVGDCPR
jgi:hypothetical protein